jgi:hypothetical protein
LKDHEEKKKKNQETLRNFFILQLARCRIGDRGYANVLHGLAIARPGVRINGGKMCRSEKPKTFVKELVPVPLRPGLIPDLRVEKPVFYRL